MAIAIIPFRNLTGGIDDSYLDSWDGTGLHDGQMAFGIVDGQHLAYVLDASSGATENSPYVVAPDTNAGTKRWILQAPGLSGIVLLESKTISDAPEIEFTNWYSSDYNSYLIELTGIKPSTDSTYLHMLMSTDGGSTYNTTNNAGYAKRFGSYETSGTVSSGTSQLKITGDVSLGNDSAYSFNGEYKLYNPGNTELYTSIQGQGFPSLSADNGYYHIIFSGVLSVTTAVNAFKFYMSSGNITGTIKIYGLK